jgi:F-type H+-transporting ATPase subunit epsilon
VSVLAEQALPRAEMTQEVFDAMIADAKAAMKSAEEVFKNEPGPVDDAAKLISDMIAMGGHIGLSSN